MATFNPVKDANRQIEKTVEDIDTRLSRMIKELQKLQSIVAMQQTSQITGQQLVYSQPATNVTRGFFAHDVAELGTSLSRIAALGDALEMFTHPNALVPQIQKEDIE